VVKIIEEMDHKDFNEVQRFLIGLREAEQIMLHSRCDFNENELKHHNLFADLTIFIDLYGYSEITLFFSFLLIVFLDTFRDY